MKVSSALKCSAAMALIAWLFPAAAFAQYVRTDLTSDQPGVAANTSPHLVNGWGLVQLGTSPFWISDNGTGLSTLYNGLGQLFPTPQKPLVVAIPTAPGSTQGSPTGPTGVVGNITLGTSNEFKVSNGQASAPAIFIFATLDGLIVGWNPNIGGTNATVPTDFTIKPGASYTGLAIATDAKSGQTFLYAADDSANRQIDMYNSSYTRVQSFGDPEIPSNYAPYGIQAVNGQIWVTYTPLNKAQSGVVDIFNTDGTLAKHDAVHGPLHSPWGIALAPPDFGPISNAILISNNTSRGRVNAFDPNSGEFLGPLRDASGKAIEIDNVWAIQFGHDGGPGGTPHNSLFFTAGPDGYAHGLFGVITFGQ